MRVIFDPVALGEPDLFPFFDRILSLFDEALHEWEVDRPDIVEETPWFKGCRSHYLKLFEEAAKNTAWNRHDPDLHIQCLIVTASPKEGPDLEMLPAVAAIYLRQPLIILMENRFTDGLFLDAVIEILASERFKSFRKTVPQALKYDSGGGIGEVPKLVHDHMKEAGKMNIPARILVFTDSDGTVPGEVSRQALKVREMCDSHGIPCCILKKRSIENYLPDPVFESWCNGPGHRHHSRLAALLRLAPDQRDHFPIKRGLPAQLTAEEETLYASVGNADMRTLRRGFGDGIINLLKNHADALTVAAFQQRDGHGELEDLLAMIIREI